MPMAVVYDREGARVSNGRRKYAYIRLSEDSLKGLGAGTKGVA